MTNEWLEEQLSTALDNLDKRDVEINELKDIISELLPIDAQGGCIGCNELGAAIGGVHSNISLCFDHPHYDRARKVLEIEAGDEE